MLQSTTQQSAIDALTTTNSAASVMGAIFDLATVEDIEVAEVQLKRNGTPLPIFVTMAGPEHPKRKLFAFNKQRRVRKQLEKTGKMVLGDPAEDELEETDQLIASVQSWRTADGSQYLTFAGEQLECNRENLARLLNNKKLAWFRRSLKEVYDDGEAFIKVSATE